LRGRLAAFEGNFPLAIIELRSATRAAPNEATISLALAKALYQGGRSKAAVGIANEALQRWPESFAVWVQAADFQSGLFHHKEAEMLYRRAIALGARSETVQLAHAAELQKLGKIKDEETQYRKLLATTSGSAEVHYRLALLLHRQGKYEAAIKHADKASELSPYDLRVWALLSTSFAKLGRQAAAADALRQPFDRSGGNASVGDELLTQLLDLNNQKAATELVAILDRDDLPIDTRISMGHMLLRLGEFDAALRTAAALDTALASNAAIAELRYRTLRALHRDDEAKAQLLAISEKQKGFALTRALLAELLADQGDYDQAKQVVAEALKLHSDNADLVLAQASVVEKSGDHDGARGLLRAAMERHPDAQRPRFALAELESRDGQVEAAISLITPLIEQDPRDASALNYVGYSLIENESTRERARSLLLRALELSPDSAFILDSFGWLLLQAGDIEQAATFLERAARLSQTEPELIWHLAELRWRQKQPAEALRLLARAESLAQSRNLREKIQRRRQILSPKP
jgi:tetratricopeptide (TPR) repeat protein